MKRFLSVAYVVLLLALVHPVSGEMLKNPPVDFSVGFTDSFTLFPTGGGWMDLHLYERKDDDLTFGKDLDMAAYITVFSSRRVAFTGMIHEIFQGRHLLGEEKWWLFAPRLIITDLRLMLDVSLSPVILKLGFHHDCAHALDRYLLRNVIHEAFLLGGETESFLFPWGDTGFYSSVKGGVEMEINILAFLQVVDYEPDRFRISFYTRLEPVKHKWYGSLFAEARVSVMKRETVETAVEGVISPALDWYIRGGYRTPGKRGGITIYVQQERLTDGWEDLDPQPINLFSFGMLMSIDQP